MKKIRLYGICLLLLLPSCAPAGGGDASGGASSAAVSHPATVGGLFPDPAFATDVAAALGKAPDAAVTPEELAAFRGPLSAGIAVTDLSGIGYLTGLTAFSCNKAEITRLPDEIGALENLITLNLYKSFLLERLPAAVGNLKKLEYLDLSLCPLRELPPEIGGCERLRVLIAAAAALQSVPVEIGALRNLEYLDLHSNEISEIPDSLCGLARLKSLDLGYTRLELLPENIGALKGMERLDLFGCALQTLPAGVREMKKLRYLNVYNNFTLEEAYKSWFPEPVYTCSDDPEADAGWAGQWADLR